MMKLKPKVDWGVVCLLAAYCGSNSPLAPAMGSR